MTDVLVVSGLSVRFGGVSALDDVSFSIGQREVVAVVGPNGAGKSTLLNAISGLIREPATGTVELNGRPIGRRTPERVAQAGISRSFQNPTLIEAEPALANVMLGRHLASRYGVLDQLFRRSRVARAERETADHAFAVLDLMGIAHVAHERVASLPYGTRKLIDIARAVVAAPRLLLLDEPTSGLDAAEQESVGRIIRTVHESTGMSVLVVEHHMDVVRSVADKVLGLASGQVVAWGLTRDVLEAPEFLASIIGGGPASSPGTANRRES